MPAPKRRWFAYSLRTLFVVMTVFACWLGYQLNWIRQRHNAKIGFGYLQIATTGPIPCHAPWPLRWFGEEGHSLLLVPNSYTKEEMDRIQGALSRGGSNRPYPRACRLRLAREHPSELVSVLKTHQHTRRKPPTPRSCVIELCPLVVR